MGELLIDECLPFWYTAPEIEERATRGRDVER